MNFEEINPGEHKRLSNDDATLEKIGAFIQAHCKTMLSANKAANKFLYRGIDAMMSNNSIFLANPRTDRRPLDTKVGVQSTMDDYLRSQGFTALRTNSIFCTSDYEDAALFGDVFIIFPLDGFSYTWSMRHADWVITEKYLSPNYTKLYKIFKMAYVKIPELRNTPEFKTYLSEFVLRDSHDYRTTLGNIQAFMKNIPPVAFHFFSENLIRGINRVLEQSLDLKMASESFIEANKIIDTRLDSALKMDHEVMICGRYVAIQNEKYGDILKGMLL
jgi:hypothetical protein